MKKENKTMENFIVETKPNKSTSVICFTKKALKNHDDNLISQERKQWEKELRIKLKELAYFENEKEPNLVVWLSEALSLLEFAGEIGVSIKSKEKGEYLICGCPRYDENSMCVNQEHCR